MTIKFLIAAEDHLDDIYNMLEEKSQRSAIVLYNSILNEIERLRNFPKIAQIEPVLINEPQEFRSLVVQRNYKVVYYIEEDTIYIAAIWGCRQNPKTNKRKIR
jgi:plasmid stabilization system protein ParE